MAGFHYQQYLSGRTRFFAQPVYPISHFVVANQIAVPGLALCTAVLRQQGLVQPVGFVVTIIGNLGAMTIEIEYHHITIAGFFQQ